MIRNVVWVSNRYWRFFESYERCGVPRLAKQLYAGAGVLAVAIVSTLVLCGSGWWIWLLLLAIALALAGFAAAYRHKLRHIRYRVSRICAAPCHSHAQAKRLMLRRYQRRYRIKSVRETVKYIDESVDKCMERHEFDQLNHYQWQVLSLSWLSKLGTSPWWLISAVAAATYFAADKSFAVTDMLLAAVKANPMWLGLGPLILVGGLLVVGQLIALTVVGLNMLSQRAGITRNSYSRQRLHYLLGDLVYFIAQK